MFYGDLCVYFITHIGSATVNNAQGKTSGELFVFSIYAALVCVPVYVLYVCVCSSV